MGDIEELTKVLAGMKAYVDEEVGKVRGEFAGALEAHVHAINELQGVVAGLMTEQTLSAAFDGGEYRRFVVAEAARMGVKPSDIVKARKAAEEEKYPIQSVESFMVDDARAADNEGPEQ